MTTNKPPTPTTRASDMSPRRIIEEQEASLRVEAKVQDTDKCQKLEVKQIPLENFILRAFQIGA